MIELKELEKILAYVVANVFNMKDFFHSKHFANTFVMYELIIHYFLQKLVFQHSNIANVFDIDNVFCLEDISNADLQVFFCIKKRTVNPSITNVLLFVVVMEEIVHIKYNGNAIVIEDKMKILEQKIMEFKETIKFGHKIWINTNSYLVNLPLRVM